MNRFKILGFLLFTYPVPFDGEFSAAENVPQFGVFEKSFRQAKAYANPYVDLSAEVTFDGPDDDDVRIVPLFWDGGRNWRLRFSPDATGVWRWRVSSADEGMNGRAGSFHVVESDRPGAIEPMPKHPRHFQRQNGAPFWFFGDTAWGLYTDNVEEKHDRRAVTLYVDRRAKQGFNVVHSMLLSEAGWGNRGGMPFDGIRRERLNARYFQEVDWRVRYLNRKGIVAGLALAWGDKRRVEPFAWGRFPSLEAKKRYARYIAARYSALDVYFIVSGEWHAEIRATSGATESAVQREFTTIGNALRDSDPHHRMVSIHPMAAHGSVREYVGTSWMAFGDYQQNYRDLHQRILVSADSKKPIVNSEYGYFLRDRNGDGIVDKHNSVDLESIRHATWDIAMAGGYFVTGFGTTYFGGNRDPGPFDPSAESNEAWEGDVQHVPKLFTGLKWWRLSPIDHAITADAKRSSDRTERIRLGGRTATVLRPPECVYWLLADPGHTYVAYVRGFRGPYCVQIGGDTKVKWNTRYYDPRHGDFRGAKATVADEDITFSVPDTQDWILLIERAAE